jgi:hypothetical protein
MIKAAMILNMAIFGMFGYVYGVGAPNEPTVDTASIERAIYFAMIEN